MPIEALDKVTGILFGSALTVLTACLLGRLLLAQLGGVAATLTRAESWILGFALGAACLSNAVFLLCSMGWVYDPVLLTVAAVTGLLWWRWGRRDIVKCCGWARSGGVFLNHQSILENLSL